MSNSVVRRVGVIGLGKIGQPMVRHVRMAGFEVTAYDVDASARAEADRSGVAIAPRSLLKTPKAKEILEFLRHSEF